MFLPAEIDDIAGKCDFRSVEHGGLQWTPWICPTSFMSFQVYTKREVPA